MLIRCCTPKETVTFTILARINAPSLMNVPYVFVQKYKLSCHIDLIAKTGGKASSLTQDFLNMEIFFKHVNPIALRKAKTP